MDEKDNLIVVPTFGSVEPLSRLYFINRKNIHFLTGRTQQVHNSVHSSFVLLILIEAFMVFNFSLSQWQFRVVIITIVGLLLVFMYQDIKRLKSLSEQGKIIQGNIVRVDQTLAYHPRTRHWWKLTIYYEFKTRNDKLLGKRVITHTAFPEQFPSQGMPIVVLYQDDENYTIL